MAVVHLRRTDLQHIVRNKIWLNIVTACLCWTFCTSDVCFVLLRKSDFLVLSSLLLLFLFYWPNVFWVLGGAGGLVGSG